MDPWKFKAYKIVAIIFVIATLSITSFLIYVIENPPTFNLTISFDDFYIQDIDTNEKNYSYYIHAIQVEGIKFREYDWNKFKNMNSTEFILQAYTNPLFMEQNIWGIIETANGSVSVDNSKYELKHTPVVIISSILLYIQDQDGSKFEEASFELLNKIFIMNATMLFSDYPYKSTTPQEDMSIHFLGASYNYTSSMFVELYIEFNGVSLAIPY